MKGDFTRWTFSRLKNYSSVLLQQGRVLLDADWNEHRDIELYRRRALIRDVVGDAAGPLDATGYAVEAAQKKLRLRAGRYYVDGILCELHADTWISSQPDLPGVDPTAGLDSGRYAVFLDVWERHVSSVEDPDIKEKALGGPDHSTRAQVIAQARLLPLKELPGDDEECETLHNPELLAAVIEGKRGKLAVSYDPEPGEKDPCVVHSTARYRGLENQLYRVEIHDPARSTFKWSRDNGSVVTSWEGHPDPDAGIIEVGDLGPDSQRSFSQSDVLVELLDDTDQLAPRPGYTARVSSSDEASRTITLHKDATAKNGAEIDVKMIERGSDSHHPRVRRWDGGLNEITDQWVKLERGIRVRFELAAGEKFRSGDYWLIPARTIDSSITWEPDEPQRPHGVQHHYACLAIVDFDKPTNAWTVERSCQRHFPSADSHTHIRYVGGDGQQGVLGAELPAPLQVQVLNGGVPVNGASVRFRVVVPEPADGSLEDLKTGATGTELTVTTGDEDNDEDDGVASVRWTLAGSGVDQRVHAILLDECGDETEQLVSFSAHESQASEVRYAPECQHLVDADVSNVQDALDALCTDRTIYYVSGAGQQVRRGQQLPLPLIVRVANEGQALAGVVVRFRIEELSGSGSVDEASGGTLDAAGPGASAPVTWGLTPGVRQLDIKTDANGVARIIWTYGQVEQDGEPGVRATLLTDALAPTTSFVNFSATVTVASAGCEELVARPGEDLQALVDQIPQGAAAHVCFAPGRYDLRKTVLVEGKGDLKFTGAGEGSWIRARGLESALMFRRCRSVRFRDLHVQTGRVSTKTHPRLNGSITFEECERVTVENSRVQCGRGPRRAGACLTVRSLETPTSTRIRACDFRVGEAQVGVLVINSSRVQIEDNTIQVARRDGIDLRDMLADEQFRRRINEFLLTNLKLNAENNTGLIDEPAPKHSVMSKRLAALNAAHGLGVTDKHALRVALAVPLPHEPRFSTSYMLEGAWSGALANLPINEAASRAEVRRAIRRRVDRIISNLGEGEDQGFAELLARIAERRWGSGSQGIVVGGSYSPDTRILNNNVSGVVQGIHVGHSHGVDSPEAVPVLPDARARLDRAGRTLIVGNSVEVNLAAEDQRARHGVFSGNSESTIIESNIVRVSRRPLAVNARIEGIRVYGSLGALLMVHKNHVIDASVGIKVRAINPFAANSSRWRVFDNIAQGAYGANEISPAMP